jgi:hypothetical protein
VTHQAEQQAEQVVAQEAEAVQLAQAEPAELDQELCVVVQVQQEQAREWALLVQAEQEPQEAAQLAREQLVQVQWEQDRELRVVVQELQAQDQVQWEQVQEQAEAVLVQPEADLAVELADQLAEEDNSFTAKI